MSNGMRDAMKVIYCALALSSCYPGGDQSSAALKIIQGQAAEALSYPVVALLKEDSAAVWYAYCSGVMIAPDRLLTAAHCTQNASGVVHEPHAVRVNWGQNEPKANGEEALAVEAVFVHPRYNTSAMAKDKDGLIKPGEAYDIALWKLSQPITHEAFHPAMIASAEELAENLSKEQDVLLLGYGQTSLWASPWETQRLMAATTGYKPRLTWNVKRRVMVDGRLITRTVTLEFPAFTSTEFYAGDRGQPDTCKGDSGGPAMIKDSQGQWKLLGLTSRGDASCDRGGVYTLVPVMQSWFENL